MKCISCNKTFSVSHIEKQNIAVKKRIVLHLLLCGCVKKEISDLLNIKLIHINKWTQHLLLGYKKIIPSKSLLSPNTLYTLIKAIEKSRIAGISNKRARRK